MKRWLAVNLVALLGVILLSWLRGFDSHHVFFGKVMSQLAVLFFAININMYFVFLIIRKSKEKKVKVTLAKLARKMMKFHVSIALIGTLLIIIHAIFMMVEYQNRFNMKLLSGWSTLIVLGILLLSGWLRSEKASGSRRKLHFRLAFLFLLTFLTHILI